MVQKIWKKKIIFIARALFLGMMSAIGIFLLAKDGEEAIRNLGYDRYIEWAEGTDIHVGKIIDSTGTELWSMDFPGYEDTYSIVGELKTNYSAENTVAVQYADVLMGTDSYGLISGSRSLSDAGHDVTLTLRHDLNERIYNYMKENGVESGSVLLTEAGTGRILAAVSLPGASPYAAPDDLEDGALLNKNLLATIPGSTMKIVTSCLLAAEQGVDLPQDVVDCSGSYHLADGDITCVTQRGKQDITRALGYSCNVFFGQEITRILDADLENTWERLEQMGFNKEGGEIPLDRLHRTASSTGYNGDGSFSGTWSLIGQGTTQVSPIDMVRVVSALVNGGISYEPYLIECITDTEGTATETHETKTEKVMSPDTAQQICEIWRGAYDIYYSDELYDNRITMAKTGTAQYGDGSESSLLMGYIEESDMAFYVEIKNREGVQISPTDVINYVFMTEE